MKLERFGGSLHFEFLPIFKNLIYKRFITFVLRIFQIFIMLEIVGIKILYLDTILILVVIWLPKSPRNNVVCRCSIQAEY